jgi:hypothetical protein
VARLSRCVYIWHAYGEYLFFMRRVLKKQILMNGDSLGDHRRAEFIVVVVVVDLEIR